MKKDIIEQIKKTPFKKWDFFIYLCALVVVALLFVFLIVIPKSTASQGFYVSVEGEKILTFYYSSPLKIEEGWKDKVVVDEENYTLTIYLDDNKSEFNVIKYDNGNKSFKMIDSSCEGKDCQKFTGNYSYCAPHKLSVSSIDSESEPVVG